MLPLPQPEFQNLFQPGPWLVKAKIAFGPQQRYKALRHNVGETDDSQNMNDEEQGSSREQPGRNLRSGLEVFHHGTLLLLVELPGPIELRCPLAILPCPASLHEQLFQGFLFTRGWRQCLCQLDGRGRNCKWNGYTNCCRWLGRGFQYLLRLRQYFLLALARWFHLLRLCPYFLRALARGCDSRSVPQLLETQFQKRLQTPQIGRSMHVSAESEKHRAVVTQDGAVDRHLAAHRHIWIPAQHLVAQQIERVLRPGHIGAHQVEDRDRQLAQHLASERLHHSREHADQTARQAD